MYFISSLFFTWITWRWFDYPVVNFEGPLREGATAAVTNVVIAVPKSKKKAPKEAEKFAVQNPLGRKMSMFSEAPMPGVFTPMQRAERDRDTGHHSTPTEASPQHTLTPADSSAGLLSPIRGSSLLKDVSAPAAIVR